jgi:CcmD family protein
MITIRRTLFALILFALGCAAQPPSSTAAAQPPPQQQDEFTPIEQLPAQEPLPAAPLLITAYSFVLVALFAYLVSVARRLAVVQREVERLETDLKRSGHR